jgi:hypothetical protein
VLPAAPVQGVQRLPRDGRDRVHCRPRCIVISRVLYIIYNPDGVAPPGKRCTEASGS